MTGAGARCAMGEVVEIFVDGQRHAARRGVSVAAALLEAGVRAFRVSVTGEPRAPLCGMGVCHECRVTIDGAAHRRSCMVLVATGMRVTTGEVLGDAQGDVPGHAPGHAAADTDA